MFTEYVMFVVFSGHYGALTVFPALALYAALSEHGGG